MTRFFPLLLVLGFTLACGGGEADAIEELTELPPEPVHVQSEPTPDAPPTDAPPPPEAPPVPTTTTGTYDATLTRASGTTLTLTTTGGTAPTVGDRGSLSKKVQKKIAGMDMSMWLEIADVEVTKVGASTIKCTVTNQKADMTVNGKKVDHFTAGALVKLKWTH